MQQLREEGNQAVLTKSTEHFLDFLKDQVNEDGTYAIGTRKQLEESYGKSRSVIDRKLKELTEKEIITCVTKRGKNGGTIITLNYYKPSDFNAWVKKDDSVITSNEKYARDLRKKVFPKYKRPLGQGRPRRTKEEMRAYKLARTEFEKLMVTMNQSTSNLYPSKEVFNMAPDPEGYYKAYTMARLYDVMCYEYMKQAWIDHKNIKNPTEKEKSAVDFYYTKMLYYRNSNILGKDFFGTKLFNTFYNAYNKLKESKLMMSIEEYMHSVFKNYVTHFEYYRGTKYGLKSPVPYPNYLHSETAFKNFYQHRDYLRKNKCNFDSYLPIGNYVSIIGIANPVYKAISRLFNSDFNNKEEHNIIEDKFNVVMKTRGLYSPITDSLYTSDELSEEPELQDTLSYFKKYRETIDEVKSVIEDEKEYKLIDLFLKQLYMIKVDPMKLTIFDRMTMYPVQQRYYFEMLDFSGRLRKDREESYACIGAVGQPIKQEQFEDFARAGEEYSNIANGGAMYQIINMYMGYNSTALNVHEVHNVINKYKLNHIIKLDKNGLLV